MCRFLAYNGPSTLMQDYLFDPSYSLVNQSKRARMSHEPVNGDGFGLGWYPEHDDKIPGAFVSIEPAWSNRNLREIAAKIPTRHFFAHVRDATPGMPVSQANCHPFKSEQWLWMHNGYLSEFATCRRLLLSSLSDEAFQFIKGNTDSEHVFALFLDQMRQQAGSCSDDILVALTTTIERLNDIRQEAGCTAEAHLNFALTNGHISLYSRLAIQSEEAPPSLHYRENNGSLVVASEPLSEDGDWQQVEHGQVLIKEEGKSLQVRELAL